MDEVWCPPPFNLLIIALPWKSLWGDGLKNQNKLPDCPRILLINIGKGFIVEATHLLNNAVLFNPLI